MSITIRPWLAWTSMALLGMVLVLKGCGGGGDSDPDEPVTVDPTLSSLWEAQFNSCGLVCHNPNDVGNGTAPGPDLRTQQSFFDQLVNRTVNTDFPDWVKIGTCNDIPFVTPEDSVRSTLAASLIVELNDQLKILENCDSSWFFHDQNNITLSQEVEDALVQWIESGAPNN